MRAAGLLLAALAAAHVPARVAAETPAAIVVIRAARLIDGRGGAPLSPAMVRIEGDRIAEVGSRLAIPSGSRLIDLGDA
ncbi:MAG TPA: amidohydrolase family protein, partial [Vicinamibacteria bacterium]|nr:amidohydrolase family protein [Vicinamibacteria bacterium]